MLSLSQQSADLALQVERLMSQHNALRDLIGEILATFQVNRNRQQIQSWEHGPRLMEIADSWCGRYWAIERDGGYGDGPKIYLIDRGVERARAYQTQELQDGIRQLADSAAWDIGELAGKWLRKPPKGYAGIDYLAAMTGVSVQDLEVRVKVFERFAGSNHCWPRLNWSHFRAALEWDDADELLKWANDIGATVAEMRAFRRAQRGEDLSAEQ